MTRSVLSLPGIYQGPGIRNYETGGWRRERKEETRIQGQGVHTVGSKTDLGKDGGLALLSCYNDRSRFLTFLSVYITTAVIPLPTLESI